MCRKELRCEALGDLSSLGLNEGIGAAKCKRQGGRKEEQMVTGVLKRLGRPFKAQGLGTSEKALKGRGKEDTRRGWRRDTSNRELRQEVTYQDVTNLVRGSHPAGGGKRRQREVMPNELVVKRTRFKPEPGERNSKDLTGGMLTVPWREMGGGVQDKKGRQNTNLCVPASSRTQGV